MLTNGTGPEPHGLLRFPLVLRHVPPGRLTLAERSTGLTASGRSGWWELVDAAGDDRRPAAGVAVVASPTGSPLVAVLEALVAVDRERLARLASELVTALRREGADTLACGADLSAAALAVLEDLGCRPEGALAL
jgi:hypothetical protein